MHHYRCDKCSFALDIDLLPRVYVLPDGREVPMLQRHAWCTTCKAVSVAEALTEDPETTEWRNAKIERNNQILHTKSGDVNKLD